MVMAEDAATCGSGAGARRDAVRARRARHAAARGLLPAARQRHHARHRRDLRRPRLGAARSTRSSPASTSCGGSRTRARRGGSSPFVMEERAIPRQGMPIAEGGEVTSGHALADARAWASAWATSRPRWRAGEEITIDVRGKPRRREDRPETDLQARGALTNMAAAESYPDDLRYHPEHDWARDRGRRGDARDHLVRAGLARRARPLRAAGRRRDDREGHAVRRGRVGEGSLRPDLAALGRGARGQPEGRRRARDRERGSVRRGLARPRRAWATRRELDGAARRGGVPEAARRAARGLHLADRRDREEMLATIGVSSVEELFRDIPAGVRLGRPLDLEPALVGAGDRRAPRGARRAERRTPASSSRSSAPASTTTTSRRSSTPCSRAASS